VIQEGTTHTTELTNTTRKPVAQRTGLVVPVGVEIAKFESQEAIEGNNSNNSTKRKIQNKFNQPWKK
jgi:hypothetical protein